MRLSTLGVSCLGSFGTGHTTLWSAIEQGVPIPTPVPRTQTDGLKDFFQPRMLRQIDHFSRMALLGSCLALQNAGKNATQSTGIIVATGFGPATPTFSFLQSLLEFGEGLASPLAFSHSVHNIPAAIVAIKLGAQGPCATICQPVGAVGAGLCLAHAWLAEGRVEHVLFIAADELPQEMEHALAASEPSQQKPPLGGVSPRTEGCAAFLLAPYTDNAGLPCLQWQNIPESTEEVLAGAVTLTTAYPTAAPATGHTVLQGAASYGRMPVSLALGMAAAVAAPTPILCVDQQCSLFKTNLYTHVLVHPGA